MISETARAFVAESHKGVLSTVRRDGAIQMSIIVCGPWDDGVAFTTTEDRAKLRNLRRNAQCSLLVAKDEWWGYLVFEGHARIMGRENTNADELRLALRKVYRRIAGEHDDWEAYDRAMVAERRALVIVVPDRVYGTVDG